MTSTLRHPGGRPTKLQPQQLSELLTAYIAKQKASRKAVLITDFCIFADISLETLTEYGKSQRFAAIVKKLRLHAENALNDKLLNDNKPVGAIFLLKARFGYIEQQKLDITSNGETLGVVQLPARQSK